MRTRTSRLLVAASLVLAGLVATSPLVASAGPRTVSGTKKTPTPTPTTVAVSPTTTTPTTIAEAVTTTTTEAPDTTTTTDAPTTTTTQPAVTTTTEAPTVTTTPVTAVTESVKRVVPTRFGIGVHGAADSTGILGWMPRTTVPWDYAYRYIGGGLNTGPGKNWTDWAPDATMPINYATAAESKGYTPVFSYYTLLAAIGPCASTCGEAQRDLTNLNSPSVMALYYADFAKLMQRLGNQTHDGVAGYGKDAIVHVEPDLSGYAQSATSSSAKCFGFCTGVGHDPSMLRASVRSSGFPQAASYPDTYRGFNQTLLKLRDVYAPNVRLAFHVSNWATGFDLNSATTPLDPVALGQKAGAFAAASGASWTDGTTSTFDLLFNDVSNKDAGHYTYLLGKPRFWDQDNAAFPNFHRWEAYVKTVTDATGRKAIVWQVPIGNQLYLSMNNTVGHFQDNRVEYFFSHLEELRASGIVGLLFGKTTTESTANWDAAGDGVTNPPPICNSDGWSSGKVVCTSLATPGADDDGGYLRFSAKAYYAAPLPL